MPTKSELRFHPGTTGFFAVMVPPPCRTVLVLLVVAALASPGTGAGASTLRIDPQGGGDFTTIAAGVTAASQGDTLLLAPGTYRESVIIERKSLTLRGEAGAASTILDGEFRRRILEVRLLDRPLVVEDLTFRRGTRGAVEFPANSGGAIAALTAPLTLRRCVFRENQVSGLGGAVYCTVVAVPGVGSPGPRQVTRKLIIENCSFELNVAGDEGGAVFCDNTDLEMRETGFEANRAVGGGGVLLLSGDGLVQQCTFRMNHARVDGGALRQTGAARLEVEATRFESNSAERHGGAIATRGVGLINLATSVFLHQTAGQDGGGVHAVESAVRAERVLWSGGVSRRGGGLFLEQGEASRFERCTWVDHTTEEGPALRLQLTSADFHRCLFGEGTASPVRCNLAAPVTGSCNAGEHASNGCLPVALVTPVEICPADPERLCVAPEVPGCGLVGHEDERCEDAECSTAVVPTTWGRVKSLHR